jgi:hypothetical protein
MSTPSIAVATDNLSVNTDAQGRPAARASSLSGRRLLLR